MLIICTFFPPVIFDTKQWDFDCIEPHLSHERCVCGIKRSKDFRSLSLCCLILYFHIFEDTIQALESVFGRELMWGRRCKYYYYVVLEVHFQMLSTI